MKKLNILTVLILLSVSLSAQDTSKVLKHELGFNTVSLIKQVISNNPASTLPQLPYDIFYNYYFTPGVNMRLGLGLLSSSNKTSIEGQATPRTTKSLGLDVRLGVSYNFVKQKRLTLNAFVDLLNHNSTTKTANTQTTQVFGDPVEEITTTTKDATSGYGAQIGAGVKYNILPHLSLYVEVPVSFMMSKTTSEVMIRETGSPSKTTTTTSDDTATRIFLPTTVYLVLRF